MPHLNYNQNHKNSQHKKLESGKNISSKGGTKKKKMMVDNGFWIYKTFKVYISCLHQGLQINIIG